MLDYKKIISTNQGRLELIECMVQATINELCGSRKVLFELCEIYHQVGEVEFAKLLLYFDVLYQARLEREKNIWIPEILTRFFGLFRKQKRKPLISKTS